MVSTNTIHNIVGIVGDVVAFGVFMSPMPTFCRIYRRKEVEEYSPNPYLAGVMNCLLWILYGLPMIHPNSIPVLSINCIGLVVELSYIIVYIRYAPSTRRLWVSRILGVELVFYALVTGLTLGMAHTHEKRSLIVGILCVVFGICMYAMPLDVMRLVMRTRSVEYMPFFLIFASFLNGCIWLIYALLQLDYFILVCNGVGALLGIGQLVLYATYRNATPKEDAEMHPRSEV